LALGERRAQVVKAYLQSLGLPADRFRTVSYGKEFPFDPGHAESAWAKNRRAHLMVTSK
jgi:peptidoglycan-associated lipoprotein